MTEAEAADLKKKMEDVRASITGDITDPEEALGCGGRAHGLLGCSGGEHSQEGSLCDGELGRCASSAVAAV